MDRRAGRSREIGKVGGRSDCDPRETRATGRVEIHGKILHIAARGRDTQSHHACRDLIKYIALGKSTGSGFTAVRV